MKTQPAPSNMRLPVYGLDRKKPNRPCLLWPLAGRQMNDFAGNLPDDVQRKIASMLATRPRLPTPEYNLQVSYCRVRRGSQFLDAVSRACHVPFIYTQLQSLWPC